ncbi:hypothetical protein GCM10010411_71770 [Actinomadura fulvescens]|uniref:Uncharacterized protein n=1 Tax=Actinomadura fulvescens TaxID=46160 RepID=A0ABN3QFX5_9ACTN
MAGDRRDPGLGPRVAAWVDDHWRNRQRGPTWYAVAEHVQPDLALIPDAARRWYASQLVNRLMDQGWLADSTGTGPLTPGPRFEQNAATNVQPERTEDDEPPWTPGRLF